MKVITVCQPHAWAICFGGKRFENRVWESHHRGPLLIHAGKSRDWLGSGKQYQGDPDIDGLVFGAIIGIVDQVGCLSLDALKARDGKAWGHAEGPWCHEYANRRGFVEPIPVGGKQGYWFPPAAILDRIAVEVARAIPAAG